MLCLRAAAAASAAAASEVNCAICCHFLLLLLRHRDIFEQLLESDAQRQEIPRVGDTFYFFRKGHLEVANTLLQVRVCCFFILVLAVAAAAQQQWPPQQLPLSRKQKRLCVGRGSRISVSLCACGPAAAISAATGGRELQL